MGLRGFNPFLPSALARKFQNFCCSTMDDESVATGGSEGDLSIMDSLTLPDNATHDIEAINAKIIQNLGELHEPPLETIEVSMHDVAVVTVNESLQPTRDKNKFSIAHDDLEKGRIIIFHLDIEHAGDKCGIVQISVVAHDPVSNKNIGEFDEYVKPNDNAVWSEHAMKLHGIQPNQDRVKYASPLEEVWGRFTGFIEEKLAGGAKKGIIASWAGGGCDWEWMFRWHGLIKPCNHIPF